MGKGPSIDDLNKELEIEGVLDSATQALETGGNDEMESHRYEHEEPKRQPKEL